MVFQRNVEGTINKVEKAKVAVYSCPFDVSTTETKGTVLINNAEELKNFSRGEENRMENIVREYINMSLCFHTSIFTSLVFL